jgi:hypothetical protein
MMGLFNKTKPLEALLPVGSDRLEDTLLWLMNLGKPRVSYMAPIFLGTGGWYCCVEVTGKGTTLEIASDFHMVTPLAAALQCRQRAEAMMNQQG